MTLLPGNWLAGQIVGDGGARTLIIGGQSIRCAVPPLSPRGPVKVGLRPEDLRIGPAESLDAHVTSRHFLGDCVVVRLTLADGTTLSVDQRAPLCDAAIGAPVRVGWRPEDAHLFPSAEE